MQPIDDLSLLTKLPTLPQPDPPNQDGLDLHSAYQTLIKAYMRIHSPKPFTPGKTG